VEGGGAQSKEEVARVFSVRLIARCRQSQGGGWFRYHGAQRPRLARGQTSMLVGVYISWKKGGGGHGNCVLSGLLSKPLRPKDSCFDSTFSISKREADFPCFGELPLLPRGLVPCHLSPGGKSAGFALVTKTPFIGFRNQPFLWSGTFYTAEVRWWVRRLAGGGIWWCSKSLGGRTAGSRASTHLLRGVDNGKGRP